MSAFATYCSACKTELAPVFKHDPVPGAYQYSGALWIGFFGGYGMYVDEMTEFPGRTDRVLPGNPDHEAVLCTPCADRLVAQNPWIAELLNRTNDHG